MRWVRVTRRKEHGSADVKTFDRYTTVRVPYFEGLRYPDLERIDGTDDRLTAILKSRT
jgi:hypothetical protein